MEILDSRSAANYLRTIMKNPEVEEFWAIALSPTCQVIQTRMLFRGTVDSCFIHPRDIFRFGLSCNATSIVVGHNHPSGVCFPSLEDESLTERLREAGKLLQIPIVDHLIVTELEFFSFAEKRWRGLRKKLTGPALWQ